MVSRQSYLQQIRDAIEEVVEKFMGVLLHKVVEKFIFLLEARDEFLRRNRSHFLLLSHDIVKQVR